MGALLLLREAFSRLFRTGTHASLEPRRAKRIILANQIACSLGLLCFLHVYIDRAMGAELLAWLNIPIGLGYLGILLLNRAGRTWAARFTLVNYAAADILVYALAMGNETGLHLLFLPACWAPLMLFGWEERKSLVYGVLLNSSLLAACELTGSDRGLLHPLSPEVAGRMHSDTVITTLIIQILIAAYFFFGNHRAETAQEEAVEAAKSADRAKSRFLANMSHEIRTPLNGVLGITNLLLKSGLSRDKLEMAQTIQSSSLDLMSILNEILDLSKIEAGRMELENRPFEVDAAVAAVLRPFEYEAHRKGLSLEVIRDPSVPAWVSGDSARLKQVLRNLVGNALKFTSEGGVAVRVMAGARPGFLDFEVEDAGPGIPEKARGRIFQSFSQADDSTTRKYGGTGLGLAISKQIVELMGGSIGFRDRTVQGPKGGPGTVFHLTAPFPAASPPPASPASEEGPERSGNRTFREGLAARAAGLGILIVDDRPVNRKVLAGMLEEFRVRMDMAGGGQEALDACSRGSYDLIFTDCHMPGMDGLELTRRLRKSGPPGSRRPRIVGVTADVMTGSRERCLEAGMDEVLSKPLLEEDLERILAKVLPGGAAPPAPPVPPAPPAPPAVTGRVPDMLWVDGDKLTRMLRTMRKQKAGRWDEMLSLLRADLEAQVRAMRNSFERDDLAAVGEAIHALKGICLTMGLSRMVETCLSLEQSLSLGPLKTWSTPVRDLETALEPSLREVRSIVSGIDSPDRA